MMNKNTDQIITSPGSRPSRARTLGIAVLASLLYLFLLDAAIETFLSRSPLRWIITGTVAAYGALTVVLWRRVSWATKASLSFFVLLGLLALVAWRLPGANSALVILRQPASTLLAAATGLAVLLAGWILVRWKLLPWPARLATGLLATYGIAAFVVGMAARTPYPVLLRGGSLWGKAPFWLQGAFVGGLVVLPAACLLQIVYGLVRIRGAQLRVWATQVLAMGAGLVIAASSFTTSRPRQLVTEATSLKTAVAQLSVADKEKAYQEEVRELQARLARLQSYVDGFPKESIDLDILAKGLPTPQAAFEFVRDQIALEPYPGVLKGASGTLLTRGGNSLDRSLLLATILKRKGVGANIVHGTLSASRAELLLRQTMDTPDAVEQMLRSLPKNTVTRQKDDAQKRPVAAMEEAIEERSKVLRKTVEENARLLQTSLRNAGFAARHDAGARQVEILRDHFWVQAAIAGQAVDLDSSFAKANINQKFAVGDKTYFPDEIPQELFQHIVIRLVGEYAKGQHITSRTLLSKEIRSVDCLGKNIRLAVEPQSTQGMENAFQPLLIIGNDSTAGQAFPLIETEKATEQGDGGSPLGSMSPARDLLGGLAGEDEQPVPSANKPSQGSPTGTILGRLYVDVITEGPHLASARDRRVILDRRETEAGNPRSKVTANTGSIQMLPIQVWDGAISVGPIHVLHVLHTELETLKTQAAAEERALAAVYLGQPFSAQNLSPPTLSAELTRYFFASDVAHYLLKKKYAPHVLFYQERPRLAFLRHGFAEQDWSRPHESARFQEGIDVVNVPFELVGDAESSALLALNAGIADTALERAVAGRNGEFNTIPLLAAAAEQKIPLLTVGPTQKEAVAALSLPNAIRSAIEEELAQQHVLILPARLVSLNQTQTFGWWSVDPANGIAQGKMELGAGQAMTEMRLPTQKIAELSHAFAEFHGGLLGCHMMAIVGGIGQRPGQVLDIPGLPKIEGDKDFAACVVARICEFISELAWTAASCRAFEYEAKSTIKELTELIAESGVSEEVRETLCNPGG